VNTKLLYLHIKRKKLGYYRSEDRLFGGIKFLFKIGLIKRATYSRYLGSSTIHFAVRPPP
jgi:hypothetical protein